MIFNQICLNNMLPKYTHTDILSLSLSLYIYIYIYGQGAMGQLLSKLCKNEKITDISFYQMHLPKLLENILKYYRLNSFKEIAIGFNHSFQMIMESPCKPF